MIRTALVAAALALTTVPAVAGEPATLSLTFDTGVETGAVMVALYDAATYNGGQPVRSAMIDVASGQHMTTFQGLPHGDYAVKAFHDTNGNGRLDANPFGAPIEPYAFSNNARGNMGPASWDRARFTVSGDTAQTISIR
ncbi:MAG: DUF2141 domain-containing protein [Alphaproteobacteria bacterium]|nr:DUF2141 domain-containing protein [Alphaproteobacteria bacterium]MBU2378074.1 DUF2141 domain-containing protein [Alphaproteobacteria bacterium]